ncbi:MAG: DUF3180 family protein [Ancrocorticia sp.]|uniref:DUF3180 family protein n=1 Tax=Ancrocorticia sp. TaxID=2593684 RepID=UPI003F8F1C96
MKIPEHLAWLAAGALLGMIAGFVAALIDALPPFPAATAFVPLIVAGGLMWWAWQVRRFKAGKRENVPAVPVAALALASSRAGLLLTGFFAVIAAAYWSAGSTDFLRSQILAAGATALAGLALAVCGFIAERWCRI